MIAAVLASASAWSLCGLPLRAPAPHRPIRIQRILAAASAGAITVAIGVTVAPPAIALVGAAAASTLPGGVHDALVRRAARRRADAWPDFLSSVRSRLAGGDDIPDAVIASAPPSGPLGDLGQAVAEGRRQGLTMAASLEPLRSAWADATADRVIVTLAAASRAGGARVGILIAALGESVTDELRLRRAHDAQTTQQRLTATVALIAPWVLLGFTIATNPQAASAFEGPAGTAVILVGGAATGLGYVLARRTMKLSATPRVFA